MLNQTRDFVPTRSTWKLFYITIELEQIFPDNVNDWNSEIYAKNLHQYGNLMVYIYLIASEQSYGLINI